MLNLLSILIITYTIVGIESFEAPENRDSTATAINKYGEVSNGNYNGEKVKSERTQ